MFSAQELETTQPTKSFSIAELPIGELNDLRDRQHYPRGAVLFVEGQQAAGIYVLRRGRVKVSIGSAEGKTLVLRIAGPGEPLGMNATLTGQPYAATAETLEPCQIDFIAREQLLKLLERDKKAYASVALALSHKLSSVVEHARLLFLSQSVAERLARLLVKWCNEHGSCTAHGIRINSGLTHEEMAQMICASRETVTRLLSEFKRENILCLEGEAIFIRNRKALESVARC
ncbi:MAG TPA: Crp/Fnr family transcriptional regulator [Pyrinomonadaceae bacterium]|nr:Crp/Fnr family transcriptional regulator [Pyrinomonadaceae bacterium]